MLEYIKRDAAFQFMVGMAVLIACFVLVICSGAGLLLLFPQQFRQEVAQLFQPEQQAQPDVETQPVSVTTPVAAEAAVQPEDGATLEPTESAADQEAQQQPIPTVIGVTRAHPFPKGSVASAPNWDVQVLEVVRGELAWQAIQAANQFNEAAPPGQEYLLLKLKVRNTSTNNETGSISSHDFGVTGDRLIEHRWASVVEPEPALKAELLPGGEAEGWAAFAIAQGEVHLMLIIDEIANYDEDRVRYLAIDESAVLNIPEEVLNIEPNDLGLDRAEPVPFGQTLVSEDWEITVLDVVRGAEALEAVQRTNQFNDPPESGREYVNVKFGIRYIGQDHHSILVLGSFFKTIGSANVVYDMPAIVDPEPSLEAYLFPGGRREGWVTLQVAAGETGLMAVFEPMFGLGDARYLSLER